MSLCVGQYSSQPFHCCFPSANNSFTNEALVTGQTKHQNQMICFFFFLSFFFFAEHNKIPSIPFLQKYLPKRISMSFTGEEQWQKILVF